MSARDEEHALDLLGARMATAEAIVKHHRGRVFKLTGDGLLAEFVSPVEAVRAALEIQEAMRSANATAGPDDQLVPAHRHQSRRRRGKRRRPDGRRRQRRGAAGIDRAAGRHLRLGRDLRADRRQADAGRRGHGRAARQEHPAPHPCLPPDAREARHRPSTAAPPAACARHRRVSPHVRPASRPWPSWRSAAPGCCTNGSKPAPPPPQAAAAPSARRLRLPRRRRPRRHPLRRRPPPQSTAAPPPPLRPRRQGPRLYDAADVPFVPRVAPAALEDYAAGRGRQGDGDQRARHLRRRDAPHRRCRRPAASPSRTATGWCSARCRSSAEFDRCMTYAVGNKVVWSFRAPPCRRRRIVPAARPSPPITFDAATVPLLIGRERATESRRPLHEIRRASGRWCSGRDHFDWWSPSETEADAIRRNLQICGHLTGRPCVVYAVERPGRWCARRSSTAPSTSSRRRR